MSEELVLVHPNMQLLTHKESAYKEGEIEKWDIEHLEMNDSISTLLHLTLIMTMSHLVSKRVLVLMLVSDALLVHNIDHLIWRRMIIFITNTILDQ